MSNSIEQQYNEATGGIVVRAAGGLIFMTLGLLIFNLVLESSYPRLAGAFGNIAAGLITATIVLYFYERLREARETRKTEVMTRLFVARAGFVVKEMIDVFCEMHWAGSQSRPTATSKIELLLGAKFKESICQFNIMSPSLESSEIQYSRAWVDYLSDTLRRKLDTLDRLYTRYQLYLDDQLIKQIEEIIASPLPELLSGIRHLYCAELGVSPTASVATQILTKMTFPLASPCSNLADDVGGLAKSLNESIPGTVPDEPWWVGNGQPPRPFGYAILPAFNHPSAPQS